MNGDIYMTNLYYGIADSLSVVLSLVMLYSIGRKYSLIASNLVCVVCFAVILLGKVQAI